MKEQGSRVFRFALIETKPEYVLEQDPDDTARRISVQCVTCQDSIMGTDGKCFIVSNVAGIASGGSPLICQSCGDALIGIGS